MLIFHLRTKKQKNIFPVAIMLVKIREKLLLISILVPAFIRFQVYV